MSRHQVRKIRLSALAILAALISFFGDPSTAFSRIASGYSLEYLTVVSNDIGIYRIERVSVEAKKTWHWASVSGPLVRAVKGNPSERWQMEYRLDQPGLPSTLIQPGATALVFHPSGPEGSWFYNVRLDGSREWEPAITGEFRVLSHPDSILGVVEAQLKRIRDDPQCGSTPVCREVPGSSEAFEALWSGSVVYLNSILGESDLRTLKWIAQSGSGLQRVQAACFLSRCVPEMNLEPILQSMLEDTVQCEWWTGETIYPARQFAFESLRALGKAVSPPPGYRDDHRGEVVCDSFTELRTNGFEVLSPISTEPIEAGAPDGWPELSGGHEVVTAYPESSLWEGEEAKVDLELSVDRKGRVTAVKVSGVTVDVAPPGREDAIRCSAMKWVFRPIRVAGKPRPATVVVSVKKFVPGADFEADSGGSDRLYLGPGMNPDAPPEHLSSLLPKGVVPRGAWDFSVIVRVDESGRVTGVDLPSRRRVRPLVEEAISAARRLQFKPAGRDAPKSCLILWSYDFRLPSYTYGSGLAAPEVSSGPPPTYGIEAIH